MGAGIQWFIENGPAIDLLVVVSDCETPWPPERPPFPVITIRVGDGLPPPWGEDAGNKRDHHRDEPVPSPASRRRFYAMASRSRVEMTPWWRKRTIVIPPETRDEWVRLVTWELWMGLILFLLVALGTRLVTTSPDRVVVVHDVSACYAAPPVPIPCERMLYRGLLNVAFSAFSGFIMLAVASWMLWALWIAAEPRPITDDFLRLLSDSFGRDWRKPRTWPWARVSWAYGFTTLGVVLGLVVTIAASAALKSLPSKRPPTAQVETLQIFRVGP